MRILTEFYTITPYPDIIHVAAFHSWDERVMNRHIQDMTRVVQKGYAGKSYALLADGEKWTLNTPGAEDMAREGLAASLGPGLTHMAMVVGHSPVKEWQAQNMRKGFQPFKSAVFKNRSQALEWLSQAGYDTDPIG